MKVPAIPLWRITRKRYERMVDAGIFGENDRKEAFTQWRSCLRERTTSAQRSRWRRRAFLTPRHDVGGGV